MTNRRFTRDMLSFRPIGEADLPFLARLYATTRQAEMDLLPHWTAEQKQAFVQQQFEAQHTYYQEHYRTARFLLIECEGQPAGRLYIDRWPEEIRLMDIALLPGYCGQGLGTQLLMEVMEEGRQHGLPVRIHVEGFNPARRLYDRLGFRLLEDKGIYHFMEWRPPVAVNA